MTSSTPEAFAVIAHAWFDGEHLHCRPVTMTVRGGRIETIAGGDQSELLTLPSHRGAFLMPGMVDAHVHLALNGALTDRAERSDSLKADVSVIRDDAIARAHRALSSGVTVMRDAGDRHGINHAVRAAAEHDGSLPKVISAGMGLRSQGGYGAFIAAELVDVASLDATMSRISAQCDTLKLVISGLINFAAGGVLEPPQFDIPTARSIVDAAHHAGLKVMTHCSGEDALRVAVAAGVDSIEHGYFMTPAVLREMADRCTTWVPTFCPVHFQWSQPQHAPWSDETVAHLRRILDQHGEMLALAIEYGVPLLTGTDAGSMGVVHGPAIVDEIERFIEAGASLTLALSCATSKARRFLGLPDPLLTVGARFDACLLANSPFDQLAALRSPQQVWRGLE
ncbi:MAG: amidohydrolase family protein [Gammaproteobacteria bacterium]|nr:amidohydrolase family protein [Gammaproteobacteria bacterium]